MMLRNDVIHRQHAKELHPVEPCDKNSVRVLLNVQPDFNERLSVLLPPEPVAVEVTESKKLVSIRNGKLMSEMEILVFPS